MADRIKRMIAGVIDWNIACLPALVVALVLAWHMETGGSNPLLIILVVLLILASYPLFFVRDTIFGGRSIGKRIFGLYVVDAATLQPVSAGKTALKNVLILVPPVLAVDALILMASGMTLGERISHTRVLGKKALARAREGEDITPCVTAGSIIAVIGVAVIGFVLFVAFIVSIVFLSLNAQTNTEEYAIAYEYLMESETYAGLDASDVRLNSFNSSISGGERTVTYGFAVTGQYHTVEITLHFEDGRWIVCEECTSFR